MIKENKSKLLSVTVKSFIVIYMVFVMLLACADHMIPSTITLTEEQINEVSGIQQHVNGDVVVNAKLFGALPLKNVKVDVLSGDTLIPCGDVFGVKFFTEGVLVVKMSDIETKDGLVSPAKKAGIQTGDIIERINNTKVSTTEDVAHLVEKSKGESMTVTYRRDGVSSTTVMQPLLSLSDKKYKTGIWVRDSTAGIGTMTYYNPKTREFAGLGHGICDVDTGVLMPMKSGFVVDVDVTDIIKGRRASPGELKGSFDSVKRGSVIKNTNKGIFGVLDKEPSLVCEQMQIGHHDELEKGSAYILCRLDEQTIGKYDIEIVKINDFNDDDKSFVVEITDERLLSKTGGIVQGMSGSPIIQNGKLVGALTHVLVNNPQKGYGIFIEKMLSESEG